MTMNLRELQTYTEKAAPSEQIDLLENLVTVIFEAATQEFLDQFEVPEITALALNALKWIDRRGDRSYQLRIYNPDPATEGWETEHTVIEIHLDDRPFIVDSIRLLLKRENLTLHHLLHPILSARRNEQGDLTDLFLGGDGQAPSESYELFMIDRVEDPDDRKELEGKASRILEDVIAVTDDYQPMRSHLHSLRDSLSRLKQEQTSAQAPEDPAKLQEYADFLSWLDQGNFVFLGYREYQKLELKEGTCIQVVPDTGLGILRKSADSRFSAPVPVEELPKAVQAQMSGPPLLLVTKTRSESLIHKANLMDYIGIKELDAEGEAVREHRFLGLFTTRAYSTPTSDIPILRWKLQRVLALDRAREGSHDYKQIVTIFNSVPRGELFLLSSADLHRDIRKIMSIERERGVRLQLRPDPLHRGFVVMVIMPRDRFNSDIRRKIQDFLAESLEATHVDYQLAMVGDDQTQVRFHFIFSSALEPDGVDVSSLEQQVMELSRTWDERLLENLRQSHGDAGIRLAQKYSRIFSDGYKAEMPEDQAAADIEYLEKLGTTSLLVDLRNPGPGRYPEETTHLRIYHHDILALHKAFPMLENLGLQVFEQISYQLRLDGPSGEQVSIDIFRVQGGDGSTIRLEEQTERLREALIGVLSGNFQNDPLNRLVLTADLSIRAVALLRTYRGYLFQVSPSTSLTFITRTFLRYPACSAALFRFFRARFSPEIVEDEPERKSLLEDARREAVESLNQVSTLPEDEIFRMLIRIVEATVRTNFFSNRQYTSLKIRSAQLSGIPEPKPFFEIFVSSPQMEGIHLRGGKVARGGLRWSDRPDDFRTEVLGLMKTQMSKNAVIVPEGSKGGFVLKQSPQDPAALEEFVRSQYQTLIRGLLDLTDNIVDGKVVSPPDLVIHDDQDPYLVVAADKGTATFSDVANELSREYGFWLGDAFASGGSHGYDHKKEGITARGAWECVRRHFLELGIDPGKDLFTVAGIGDMAGDVFGNGMLHTDRIRLLAAFNHQHIFLDPEPDPEASFAERRRLFERPSSSWADYSTEAISPGGGIFPREAKSIALSPEARALLRIEGESASGQEIIRRILQLPVDLLWNGGVGTYVKAGSERNSEAGDPNNNGVRIDASELKARVVGEGGNLGLTQLGRIEYALGGGRLNTDAIDNSGGVDMSDHEVNIKILLEPEVRRHALEFEYRNELLRRMTDEVSRLVLRNNYTQSLCLSLASRRAISGHRLIESLMRVLEESGKLKSEVEFLPDSSTLEQRRRNGLGFTRPELAILLAYTKMGFKRALLASTLPDEPPLQYHLVRYFPVRLQEEFGDQLQRHPLRREIIATQLTNQLVDRMGLAFMHGVVEETGADRDEAIQAILLTYEILDLQSFSDRIFALDGVVKVEDQYDAMNSVSAAARGVVEWLLLSNADIQHFARTLERYQDPLREIGGEIGNYLPPETERQRYLEQTSKLLARGFPEALSTELASLDYLPSCMGVVDIHRLAGTELGEAARHFYRLGDVLQLGWLRDALSTIDSEDHWDVVASAGLISDLRHLQREITLVYLGAGCPPMGRFLGRGEPVVGQIRDGIQRMQQQEEIRISAGSFVTRLLFQLLDRLKRA